MTLATILNTLDNIDDDLPPEEFDPAAVVGELKDKVDAIKWRLDKWEQDAETVDSWIAMLAAKKKSLMGKHERLLDYVLYQMQQNGFDTIPGHIWRFDRTKSQAKVNVSAPASAHEYLNYPQFVRQKTVYEWDKKALKGALDLGAQLTFASLEQGEHIRFYARKS